MWRFDVARNTALALLPDDLELWLVYNLGLVSARLTGHMAWGPFDPATLVTYQFLHGGLEHLGMNLLALLAFGVGLGSAAAIIALVWLVRDRAAVKKWIAPGWVIVRGTTSSGRTLGCRRRQTRWGGAPTSNATSWRCIRGWCPRCRRR